MKPPGWHFEQPKRRAILPSPRSSRHQATRIGRSAAVSLLAMVAAAACTEDPGDTIDYSMTRAKAESQMLTYLQYTLNALPAGTSLSVYLYPGQYGAPNAETVGNCDDFQTRTDREELSASYHVTGIPAGRVTEYFDLLRKAWATLGWQKTYDETRGKQVEIAFVSPEGIGLNEATETNRDNTLVTGIRIMTGTPCFPGDQNTPPSGVLPAVIEHN